jgi:hypothetical protein
MQLDSVRTLKASLQARLVDPLSLTTISRRTFAPSAQPMRNLARTRRSIALGIAKKGKRDFQLAVRVQRPELVDSPHVAAIIKKVKGEADVRYIGRVMKRMTGGKPWNQRNVRPLRMGTSVGHFKITAGTLGCFVTGRRDDVIIILSNNHVLANENDASVGDVILQRGALDGGKKPKDVVGRLNRFVKLKTGSANLVDCAVASIDRAIDINVNLLQGIGTLAGQGSDFLDEGLEVFKVGRTTDVTRGRVTAFELDNVIVEYDIGDIRFDNQIEIEGVDKGAFSAGGDSGSLIIDSEQKAVALLFAGGDQGGSNGKGLTYANPLQVVLDALKVNLAF